LTSILLVLAFMFLSRIRCPEQLKTCKVGELGRIIGLDRVPEARCLRSKIAQIVDQGKTDAISEDLLHDWLGAENADDRFYYADGHVHVYHGSAANLPKRFVSREKLCLPGTTEFWINNEFGMPYMVVQGELNEKLKDILQEKIIPLLLKEHSSESIEESLRRDPKRARFVMVFDREAYDLHFFKEVWEKHRIAVLTYRKAVKDDWPTSDFAPLTTTVIGKDVTMLLAEKEYNHASCPLREIRKLCENNHQTSIVTTVLTGDTATLAGKMFSRWSQENFLRYMVHDYDLDRLAEYGVEAVNPDAEVVNPIHRQLAYQLKKTREKSARIKAQLFNKLEEKIIGDIDAIPQELAQQASLQESIEEYNRTILTISQELAQTPRKIKIKEMPLDTRYNKLKTESKKFMNLLRIIAYRAECAVANAIAPQFGRAEEEVRMLVKEMIKADADMTPDYNNHTLTVRLHTMSTPRANRAMEKLCELLNDTETIFPGSNLRLIYKTMNFQITGDQEF